MKWKLLSLLLIGCFRLAAQNYGKPLIQNYEPARYKAQTQNWAIVQDDRGVIYVGNNDGVLEYDAHEWRLIATKNKTVARSLANYKGKVYVGAVGDIGFLAPDSIGKMAYTSLLDKIPKKERDFTDVWRTFSTPDGVFFFANHLLMRYKDGKMTTFKPDSAFHLGFQVNNQLFVREWNKGLLQFQNNLLIPVRGSSIFAKERIYAMLPYDDKRILIATRSKGLFLYDPTTEEKFIPFISQADPFLLENQIYSGITKKINGETYFILGTLRGGMVILNKKGEIRQIIDKSSGLQDENINSFFIDSQNALWVSLDKGISRIELSSPLSIMDESMGLEGSVLVSLHYNGTLYVGTGLGVYYQKGNRFFPVKNTGTQSWDLKIFQGKLLAMTNDGVFEIRNDEAFLIQSIPYARTAHVSAQNPNRIFIGTYEGLTSLLYDGKNWKVEPKIKGFHHDQIRRILEEEDGKMWLGTEHRGIISLKFKNSKSLQLDTLIHYDTLHGLPVLNNISFSKIDGKLYFATEKGIYTLEKNRFVPSTIFGNEFADGSHGVLDIVQDKQNLWLRISNGKEEWIDIAMKQKDKTFKMDTVTLRRLGGAPIENIYSENKQIVWLGCPEGLFRFDGNVQKDYQHNYHVLIRNVFVNEKEELFGGAFFEKEQQKISLFQDQKVVPELDYEQNSLSFVFSAPTFDDEERNYYSFKLEGYDKGWSAWTQKNRKEYTNLPEGDYTFKVQAQNIYEHSSEIASFHFVVKPPFHRTPLVMFLYLVVTLGVVFGIVKYYTRRLEKDKQSLELLIMERTAEIVEQKEQIEEKNENLEKQKREIVKRRDEIQQSYRNLRLLSTIGQDITAIRSVEEIIETVYENANALMDASAFGISILNEEKKRLDIRGFIEKGEKLPPHHENLDDDSRLSVWCAKNKKSVVINDYRNEAQNYIKNFRMPEYGDIPESIIYQPLMIQERVVGTLTVQSFNKNAYTSYHLNIVENLANYVAISLENALLYESLEEKVRLRTSEVTEQNEEIKKQNSLIEKKNNDITASINYARRIQDAILPTREELDTNLGECFAFLKPRDIISGDFYWCIRKDKKTIVAAVDCTGHGVPGAFMSMVGNDLLNEVVSLFGITSPDLILNQMHKGVRKALKQYETKNRDGMDMTICSIDYENKLLEFAGAKNPMVYIQNQEIFVLKGDPMPIGGLQREQERIFTKHSISFQQPITCYMFSDGYQDQFGGVDGKKFMLKYLKNLFLQIHQAPMDTQREILSSTILTWMGSRYKQIDDILIIGFRAS